MSPGVYPDVGSLRSVLCGTRYSELGYGHLEGSGPLKRSVSIACAVLVNTACAGAGNSDLDHTDVESATREFYEHIEAYDYEGLRTGSSPDFEILEAGRRMDMDDFVSMLQGMETRGAELSFDLTDLNTEVLGDVGYTTYRMVSGSGNAYLEALILRRTASGWLVDRAFSTRAVD
jgi:hypothetical protein